MKSLAFFLLILDAARLAELEPGIEFGQNISTGSGSIHQQRVCQSTGICVSTV